MTGWLTGFDRIDGNGSGSWTGNTDAPKIVLHTTEGDSIDGAVAAFRAHNSWPHMTVDPRRRLRVQHVSLDEAARALRNTATPGQTNRDGRTYQIEIVGHAATIDQMSHDDLAWLGGSVIAPLAKATGTPLVTSVQFYGPDCGWTLATETARQRLSPAAWDAYRGILGHQHVPENAHWDPGHINIARILAGALEATITHPAEWQAPAFPGHTLRLGEVSDAVRTLKYLLVAAGYGETLAMSATSVRVFGPGTVKAVQALAADYYRANKVTAPSPLPGSVGPKLWAFLCDVVRVKKAGG